MKRIKCFWKWYAVKLLFESKICGLPNAKKIDDRFDDSFKLYEELIIIIKAQSPDHAYKLAEKKAKEKEITYNNPYDQTVHIKFIDSLNCQPLFDEKVVSGTEIFSRLFQVPTELDVETVINNYCEIADYHEGITTPFYNFLINE